LIVQKRNERELDILLIKVIKKEIFKLEQ